MCTRAYPLSVLLADTQKVWQVISPVSRGLGSHDVVRAAKPLKQGVSSQLQHQRSLQSLLVKMASHCNHRW